VIRVYVQPFQDWFTMLNLTSVHGQMRWDVPLKVSLNKLIKQFLVKIMFYNRLGIFNGL
jgi:hypothetical protein